MSYDPDFRRDTPLARKIKDRIRAQGGTHLADYIGECLWDEEYGYYATRSVIGQDGDFITAPEISQVFGELIGLWSAVVWAQMGSPEAVNLVEFGPGRGTLMADALRATRSVAGLHDAMKVSLMEASASMIATQRSKLAGAAVPVAWIDGFKALHEPSIIIANEFVDALTPDQCVKTDDGWRWRGVKLDDAGRLQFGISEGTRIRHDLHTRWPDAPVGSICEYHRHEYIAEGIQTMGKPVAALIIDYGHTETVLCDTLQAVRNHAYEHPLCSPGEADLTAQVDFADLASAMTKAGLVVDGPTTQAEFLGRLGIVERASKLMGANPGKAGEIEAGVMRLMTPNGMGTRFKVIGIRSPNVGKLPGFE